MEEKDKNIELPYRFTCPIPVEVVGYVEISEEDRKKYRKQFIEDLKDLGIETNPENITEIDYDNL